MKASERQAQLEKVAAKGFAPILNGLGLLAGNYVLMTAAGEDIFGIKEVTAAATGKQYAITLVACTVTKPDGSQPATFGIGETDRQLAVTADQWLGLQPNTKYNVTVTDKGRIGTVSPYSAQVGDVDGTLSENVAETPEQKQAREFAEFQAAKANA